MSDNQHRLLAYLWRAQGWVTAAELSAELGVTSRSVRNYVAAVKITAHPLEVITSSPDGYRLNPESYARFLIDRSPSAENPAAPTSPTERGHRIVRRLANAPRGIDFYGLAAELFVSESTLDADLKRLRRKAAPFSLGFTRHENQLRLTGAEADLRKLLSEMFRAESPPGFLSRNRIERAFAVNDLAGFETALGEMLSEYGFGVNGFAITDVLLHLAVAISRTRDAGPAAEEAGVSSEDFRGSQTAGAKVAGAGFAASEAAGVEPGPALAAAAAAREHANTASPVSSALAQLVAGHFGVMLTPADQQYLAVLLTTRGATRAWATASAGGIQNAQSHRVATIVRRIAEQYGIDLDDDAFISKLTLHLDNLVSRAKNHGSSRNPMARTIKTTYPLIYEIAAEIANEIRHETQITMGDDEISFIALHVGAALEREAQATERVSCTVICPGYHALPLQLVERLNSVLSAELQIEAVITRTDVVEPESLASGSDLVLTTVAVPGSATPRAGLLVSIHPFLTENDVVRVRQAIGVVRRRRRHGPVRATLLKLFEPALFVRNLEPASSEQIIRNLGDRMITAGVIGPEAVDGAIARERLSSTAFTDSLAVPHAFAHTANRSAICFAVNETAMPWGEGRVNAVAFLGLSRRDRAMFPAVFDQLVSVFADRVESARIIRRSVDFASFIGELGRVFDS